MSKVNQTNTTKNRKNTNKNFNFDDITAFPKEIVGRSQPSEKHVCSTCKTEIDSEISRVVITNDRDGGPRLFCFHFFFPCWDMTYFCQKYQNLTIERAGFSIPEDITIKENSMEELQKNLEYWK